MRHRNETGDEADAARLYFIGAMLKLKASYPTGADQDHNRRSAFRNSRIS